MRRVPTAHGWYWITQAFVLFRGSALNWILLNLTLLAIALGLVVVPVIGAYVLYLLSPMFLAGMMSACRDQERGREVEVAHLFHGFRQGGTHLITVGGVYLVGQVVIAGVVLSVAGADLQEAMRAAAEGDAQQLTPESAERISLAVLVGSALLVPLVMAVWFAPMLVVFEGVPAVRAMQLSVHACLLNLLPFLLYGAVMFGLLVVAVAPLFAGLVLWMPLAVISGYTSYRDIFVVPASSP
jgi:uncharacterized membrane protein